MGLVQFVKFRFLALHLFLTPCLSLAGPSAELPTVITIGINPGGNPENLRKEGGLFAEKLQKELGTKIKVFIPKDYKDLIKAMSDKKVDFAFFSSLSYVYAQDQAGAKVLMKKIWKSPFYYSAIVTRESSGITQINDLKGKRFAFVDENSTSGFLYPKVMFKKANLDQNAFQNVVFSGNHSASIALLESEKVDAVAVFSDDQSGESGAWSKYAKNPKVKFRVLWVSDPIPNDPFCVRQDFYDRFPKFTHTMMVTILDLFRANKDNHSFNEILGNQELVLATAKQYDPVREMVKTLNLKIKN